MLKAKAREGLQVENLASLYSTLKRLGAIEVQWELGDLLIHSLRRRKRVHTTPRHIPLRLLKFQIKLSSVLQSTTPKSTQTNIINKI